KGSSSALSCKKTSSLRRPKTYAKTAPGDDQWHATASAGGLSCRQSSTFHPSRLHPLVSYPPPPRLGSACAADLNFPCSWQFFGKILWLTHLHPAFCPLKCQF